MKILSLESSAVACSVAVCEDEKLLAQSFQHSGLTHSRTLLPMCGDLLKNCGLTLEEMDVIAVAAGPGSFTGLRIGVAAVKGLAWAADKPCVAVSTLEAMAAPLAFFPGTLICAMDARRQQVYNAVFRSGGGLTRLSPDRAISLEDLAAELDAGTAYTVVGDGAKLCADALVARGFTCALAPSHLLLQSAVGVGLVGERMAREGRTCTAQELTPAYLRLSQAERERLARLGAQG